MFTVQFLSSLHRRRNLTPVSNVCEAALILLFWVPKGLNELQEMFCISLQPDWQIDNGFLTGHSWRVLKSLYTGGRPE